MFSICHNNAFWLVYGLVMLFYQSMSEPCPIIMNSVENRLITILIFNI